MNAKPISATLLLVTPPLVGVGAALGETLTPLAAGDTLTLSSGQSVQVPSGTTMLTPDGSIVTVNGHFNTVHAVHGAVVTVSPREPVMGTFNIS